MKSVAGIARYAFAQLTEDEFVHISLNTYPEEGIINFQMSMSEIQKLNAGINIAIRASTASPSKRAARSEVCRDIMGMLNMSDAGMILHKSDWITDLVFARRDCRGFSGEQLSLLHTNFGPWIHGIVFEDDNSCRIQIKNPETEEAP